MDDLFTYHDYREYLGDLIAQIKGDSPYASLRTIGDRMGLDASFLVKVLQKKMHLSIKSLPKVCQYCEFNSRQTEFFETMVRFGRAKKPSECKVFFDRLMSLADLPKTHLTQEQYSYFLKWHHSTIRSLLSFYDWKTGYSQLAKKLSPPITITEAKESIKLLKELNLIAPNSSGFLKPTDINVSTGESWESAAIHSFQQETIELSKNSLDRHDKSSRDISTVTIELNHTDLAVVRDKVKELRKTLLQLSSTSENHDVVYQVNIQVVPTTQPPEELS